MATGMLMKRLRAGLSNCRRKSSDDTSDTRRAYCSEAPDTLALSLREAIDMARVRSVDAAVVLDELRLSIAAPCLWLRPRLPAPPAEADPRL